MFVSSLVTERILFYDLYERRFQILEQNYRDRDGTYTLPMDFSIGASHVAFDGSKVLYTAPKVEEPVAQQGAIKQFDWQTGGADFALNEARFREFTASNISFDPGVLRFDSNTSTLAFSNRGERDNGNGTDRLYFWKYPEELLTEIYATRSGCFIVDIAMERSADEVLETLILVHCKNETSPYHIEKNSTRVTPHGFEAMSTNSDFSWSSDDTREVRSIEWICKQAYGEELSEFPLTDHFYVAFEPNTKDDRTSHIFQYDSQGNLEDQDGFLSVSGVMSGGRYGIDIAMIRRAPNNLVYVSERRYGLPLVIDPTSNGVLGQTGVSHGELADSYAMAFSTNAYGLKSSVNVDSQMNEGTIVAGTEYDYTVYLKDSLGNEVADKRHQLKYVLTGNIIENGLESETRTESKEYPPQETYSSEFKGTVKATRTSLSQDNENHKWSFEVQLVGLDMQIGDKFKFWVRPAQTSPAHTHLSTTFVNITAGTNVSIFIQAHDAYGNHRSFSDYTARTEDAEDIKRFTIESVEEGQDHVDHHVRRVGPGLFELDCYTKRSANFMYDVKYNGEKLQNSPIFLNVGPSSFDVNTSRVTGLAGSGNLWKKDEDLRFKIELKDKFKNPVSAISAMAAGYYVNVTAFGIRDYTGDLSLIPRLREAEKLERIQECENSLAAIPLLYSNVTLSGDFCVQFPSPFVACSAEESNHETVGHYWKDWINGFCTQYVGKGYKVVALSLEVGADEEGNIQVTIDKDQVVKENFHHIDLNVIWTLPDGNQTFAKVEDDGTVKKVNEYAWYPQEIDHTSRYTMKERIIYMGLTTFLMSYHFVVIFLVWFWRKENAIKFSQRNMLNLFLLGTFLVSLGFWIMAFKPIYEWPYSCSFQIYFVGCGCLLAMLVMSAKLYRVHRLAYAKANKKVVITDKWLFKRIGLVISSLSIYFAVAISFSPIELRKMRSDDHLYVEDSGTEVYVTVSHCSIADKNPGMWYPFIIIFPVVLMALLFMATMNRKVPSAFAESKWVAWSIYMMVIDAMLSGILIYDEMIKFRDPAFYKGAVTYPTLASIFVAVNFIFMPKFITIWKHKALDYSDLRKGIDKKGKDQTSIELSSPGETLPRRSTAATRPSTARTGRMSTASFKPKFVKRTTRGGSESSSSSQLSSSPGAGGGTSPGGGLDLGSSTTTFSTLNPLNEADDDDDDDDDDHDQNAPKKPSKVASSDDSRLLAEALADNARLKEENASMKRKMQTFKERFKAARSSTKRDRVPSDSPWQLYQDHNGRNYYYHSVTKDCSYEKPSGWY